MFKNYMKYIELREKLKNRSVFSLQDIRKFDPSFYRTRLSEWQKKGYIGKIVRGYYAFADMPQNDAWLFSVANAIYSPSYISLEMALSYYHVIPESVYGITSVTARITIIFRTRYSEFLYHKVSPRLIFGYNAVRSGTVVYRIAELEKAILDFLYLHPELKTENDMRELRIDADEIKYQLDRARFDSYLRFFQNKALEQRAHVFFSAINI